MDDDGVMRVTFTLWWTPYGERLLRQMRETAQMFDLMVNGPFSKETAE